MLFCDAQFTGIHMLFCFNHFSFALSYTIVYRILPSCERCFPCSLFPPHRPTHTPLPHNPRFIYSLHVPIPSQNTLHFSLLKWFTHTTQRWRKQIKPGGGGGRLKGRAMKGQSLSKGVQRNAAQENVQIFTLLSCIWCIFSILYMNCGILLILNIEGYW